jgi:hypothetical protein
MNKCKCGKPAHPCYAGRCEDCWVEANQKGYTSRCVGQRPVRLLTVKGVDYRGVYRRT